MEQRRVRLGDIVDDYCPRERRVTNHAVVAMIEDEIRQTRCTACDADHPYKAAKVPRVRKKDASVPRAAVLPPPGGEAGEAGTEESAGEAGSPGPQAEASGAAPSPLALAAAGNGGGGAASSDDESAPVTDARDEGPFRRSLIRATLPRPEGQPTARPLPEFTMRQSGVRGGRLIDKEARGDQRAGRAAGSQSRPRSERHASRPEHRHGHGRPGASHGPHFDRPHGHGRGGGHARPGRGGKKRSR